VTVRSLGPEAVRALAPAMESEKASVKAHLWEPRSWAQMWDANLGHERASERARSSAAQSTGTKTANSWARRKE